MAETKNKERKSLACSINGKKGALSRWGARPAAWGEVTIAGVSFSCYVLEDERRLLSHQNFLGILNLSDGGYKTGDRRLARFAKGKIMSQYSSEKLVHMLEHPVKVMLQNSASRRGAQVELAYPAECLTELCNAVLEAREAGVLQKQQLHIAKKAEVIIRGLSHIGLVGLIDEATGYQYHREKDALAHILEKFISKEIAVWAKTFPDDFYEELFRLHNIKTININEKPWRFGKITNDIIYSRVAPGVLKALEEKNPKDGNGKRKYKHHQCLTDDAQRILNRHLDRVTGIMSASKNWSSCMQVIDAKFPKYPQVVDGEVDSNNDVV